MSRDHNPIDTAAGAGQPVLPLDGIKVLDLSRVLAGPWCTQTLADLGADVWKIEEPGRGDDTRSWTPPDREGESTYCMCTKRSTQSVAIYIKNPEGKALVRSTIGRESWRDRGVL